MASNNQRAARALELAKEVLVMGPGTSISLEHYTYERISGSNGSVRFDKGDPSKRTKDHAHVFARRDGKGRELFSVNCDGTGHDGSRGKVVPKKVAEFLRQNDFRIPADLTLESIDLEAAEQDGWNIVVVLDTDPPPAPRPPAWIDW